MKVKSRPAVYPDTRVHSLHLRPLTWGEEEGVESFASVCLNAPLWARRVANFLGGIGCAKLQKSVGVRVTNFDERGSG